MPLWARSSVLSPLSCLEHQNASTRMCSGVQASHSTTLTRRTRPGVAFFMSGVTLHLSHHPLPPRHKECDPMVAFFVSEMFLTLSLHSLLPRCEERNPTVAFFVSWVSLPLYYHPLPHRHTEHNNMVTFFMSGMLPTPQTWQCNPMVTLFMSGVSLHLLLSRCEKHDHRVAFFVSAPFPAPSTAQTQRIWPHGCVLRVWGYSPTSWPRHGEHNPMVAFSVSGSFP